MRISDRCYAVLGLAYAPPWSVNAGFIIGDDTTLVVDTGANTFAAATIHGYAVAIRPSNLMQVINTEKHFDHIGGNGFFRDQGSAIWGHVEVGRTEEEFLEERAWFNQCISSVARRSAHEENAFYAGTRLTNATRLLHRETTFDLGGCVVEALFTPGHTASNISIWVPQDGVLFSGDCLINDYLPNLDAGGPEEWRTWLKSLERIAALQPKTVLAGHGFVAHGNEVPGLVETVRRVLQESIVRGHSPTAEL